jgi:hypothetical protein
MQYSSDNCGVTVRYADPWHIKNMTKNSNMLNNKLFSNMFINMLKFMSAIHEYLYIKTINEPPLSIVFIIILTLISGEKNNNCHARSKVSNNLSNIYGHSYGICNIFDNLY